MAFTTWSALYDSMLDDLASGAWKTKSYTIGERTHTYRDFDDFKKMLEYARTQAANESGSAAGRTYAKQGGGGRW